MTPRVSTASQQPLEGLTVVDVGTFIAAPFSATMLAEFGANVIKLEEPRHGDSLRRLAEQLNGEGLWWLQESRNKRNMTCDLRHPRGQDLLRQLVREADVLVENFRPGTLDDWGIGYNNLRQVNPRLIMLSISGYGQDGPYARKPGFGRIAQAFGGLTYLAGYPDRPPVLPGSATIADYLAGMFGAFAILVAKEHRDKTGEGQLIDISLFESILRILDTLTIVYGAHGTVRERTAGDAPHAVPHNHYPTNDGNWVAIACSNDKLFARLCVAMGRTDLIQDPRYGTVQERVNHRSDIDSIVTQFTSSYPAKELVALLDSHEIPAGPINSIVEIFSDPQVLRRNSILEVSHDALGTLRMPNIVPRLSRSPGKIRHAGRSLGADTQQILRDVLGLKDSEIDGLREQGVI